MFRLRLRSSGNINVPQENATNILYSNLGAKHMLIGTILIAILFIGFSVVVFTVSNVHTSMYILIVGILILVLIVVAAKLLSHKWRIFVDELEEVLQNASASQDASHSQESKASDLPPTYFELYKEEEPPSYDVATEKNKT